MQTSSRSLIPGVVQPGGGGSVTVIINYTNVKKKVITSFRH